jgi:hypothetical protein
VGSRNHMTGSQLSAVLALTVALAGACGSSGTIHTGTRPPLAPTSAKSATPQAPAASPTSTAAAPTPPPSTPATSAAPIRSDADTVLALSVPVEKINPSWMAQLLPGGDATTTDTLDLCGASYASEAKRTARRQMQYGPDSDDLPVSNEVVTYRDNGAAEAVSELKNAVAHCPTGLVQEKDPHGGRAVYHVSKLIGTSPKWLPGTVSLVVVIDHEDGTSFTFAEVVQSRGNVLSIVYGPLGGQVLSAETFKAADAAAGLLSTTSQAA